MPSILKKRSYQEYSISDNDLINSNLTINQNKKKRKYSESGIIYMINVGKTASYYKLGIKTDTSQYSLTSRYRTSYGKPNIVAEISFLRNCLHEYQIDNSETFKGLDVTPIYHLLVIIKELIHSNNYSTTIELLGNQIRYTNLPPSLEDNIMLKFKEKLKISSYFTTFNFSKEVKYSIDLWRKKNIKNSIKLLLKNFKYNINLIQDNFENNIISIQDWCFLQNLPIPTYHEIYEYIFDIQYKFKNMILNYSYLKKSEKKIII
jgi:hypothetical protein